MYPDRMGRMRGTDPKRLPPEPYFRPPGIKIHFLATWGERQQMYARAQKVKAPCWLGSSPSRRIPEQC